MRLLLDTHIALWAVSNDARLPAKARALLDRGDAEIFVSAVTLWEIAIKYPLRRGGRQEMTVSAADARRYFRNAGYTLLDMTPAHAVAVEDLPPHHGDPFDRMLVAQALTEPLRLITADEALRPYSDTVVVV